MSRNGDELALHTYHINITVAGLLFIYTRAYENKKKTEKKKIQNVMKKKKCV